MKEFAKSTLVYSIASLVPRIAGVLVVPFYTRFLSPTEFGVLASMEALKSVLIIFITLGLERSMNRIYYDYNGHERARFLGSLFLGVTVISVTISTLLATLMAPVVNLMFPKIEFVPYYVLAIATTLVGAIGAVTAGYFRLAERAVVFVVLSVARTLGTVGLALIFLIGFRMGVVGVLWAAFLVEALLTAASFLASRKHFHFSLDWPMLRRSIAFSLPMLPGLASAWLVNQSNRVFIDHYLSQADLGVYSLAAKISDTGSMLGVAFLAAYTPLYYRQIAELGEESARPVLRTYNTFFALGLILTVFCVAYFSRELVVLFADKRYEAAQSLVPLLSLGVLISQLTALNNLALYQRKRTVPLMLAMLLSSAVAVLLNWWLVPTLGLLGAVAASILALATNYLVTLLLSKRAYYIGFSLVAVSAVGVVASVFTAVSMALESMPVWLAFGIKSGLLIVPLILVFLFFRREVSTVWAGLANPARKVVE